MVKVPRQHLLLPTLDEVRSGIRNSEESKLPVAIELVRGRAGRVIPTSWKCILDQYQLLHNFRMFKGQRRSDSSSFVMGDDVCTGYIQEVQDGEVIFCCGWCSVVIADGEGGLAASAVIGSNYSVLFGKDGTDGCPGWTVLGEAMDEEKGRFAGGRVAKVDGGILELDSGVGPGIEGNEGERLADDGAQQDQK